MTQIQTYINKKSGYMAYPYREGLWTLDSKDSIQALTLNETQLEYFGFEKVEQPTEEKDRIEDFMDEYEIKYSRKFDREVFRETLLRHMPKSKEECSDTSVEDSVREFVKWIDNRFKDGEIEREERENLVHKVVNLFIDEDGNALCKSEDTPIKPTTDTSVPNCFEVCMYDIHVPTVEEISELVDAIASGERKKNHIEYEKSKKRKEETSDVGKQTNETKQK